MRWLWVVTVSMAAGCAKAAPAKAGPVQARLVSAVAGHVVTWPASVAFSDDGRWLAFGDAHGTDVINTDGWRSVWRSPDPCTFRVGFLRAAGEQYLVFGSGRGISLARLERGQWAVDREFQLPTTDTARTDRSPVPISVSAEELRAVVVSGDDVVSMSLRDGRAECLLRQEPRLFSAIYMSPTEVLVSRSRPAEHFVLRGREASPAVPGIVLALSPDRRYRLILDGPSGAESLRARTPPQPPSARVVEASSGRVVSTFRIDDAPEGFEAQWPWNRFVVDGCFSRDAKWVATVESPRGVVIREAATGDVMTTIDVYQDQAAAAAAVFSPVADSLVTAGRRGPRGDAADGILVWRLGE